MNSSRCWPNPQPYTPATSHRQQTKRHAFSTAHSVQADLFWCSRKKHQPNRESMVELKCWAERGKDPLRVAAYAPPVLTLKPRTLNHGQLLLTLGLLEPLKPRSWTLVTGVRFSSTLFTRTRRNDGLEFRLIGFTRRPDFNPTALKSLKL